jgi:uncharacterized delta-60 repeat protein
MTYSGRILLLVCFFCSLETTLLGSLNRRVFSAENTDNQGLVVDSQGSVIHMLRSLNSNQFSIMKTDADNNMITSFGTNGVVTLTMDQSNTPSTGSTVRAHGYYIIDRSSNSYIAVDSQDRILLAVRLVHGDGNKVIAIIRLNKDTGAFDTSYSSDGVAVTFTLMNVFTLKGLAVDSLDRAIVALNHTSGGSVAALRFSNTGQSDFNATNVTMTLDGDLSIATDATNNVYLAGRSGVTGFCAKILASDMTADTSFATNGVYTINSGLGNGAQVVLAMGTSEMLLVVLGTNQRDFTVSTILINGSQGNLYNGAFVPPVVIKGVAISASGKLYIAGTMNNGGQITFWSRFNMSVGAASGDTTFAQTGDSNFIANGVRQMAASGGTVASGAGGFISYNRGNKTLAIMRRETANSTLQLVRDVATEPESGGFLVPSEIIIAPSRTVGNPPVQPQNGGKRDAAFPRNSFGGSNVSAIDDSAVVVTAYDDVITCMRTGNNFIVSRTKEDGTLDSAFGVNGSRVIKVRATGAGASTVAIGGNFAGVTAGKKSYMACDSNRNIFIAFQVNITGLAPSFVIIRLDKTTGQLSESFGFDGAVIFSPGYLTCQLDSLAVNSLGKMVLLLYVEDGGDKFPQIHCFNTDGTIDFDLAYNTSIANAVAGMALKIDVQDNIFIAGKYGASSPYGLFSIKLNHHGTIDPNFATAGKYTSGSLAGLTTNSQVFLSLYEYLDAESVQIITQSTANSGGIAVLQLTLTGTADSVFNGSHVISVAINNITKLNYVERNEEGDLMCGGTVTDGGVVKIFLSRITKEGVLDTTYGDTSGGVQTGTTIFTATAGTIQDGGWSSTDSGEAALIVWIEQEGAARRVILERAPTNDDFSFNSDVLKDGSTADDFSKFVQGYMLDSSRLYANLGIARHLIEFRKALEADTSGHLSNSTVKDRAVTLFDAAIKTILQAKVNSASSNGLKSAHVAKHKQGSITKEMDAVMKSNSNFTSNQQTALAPHVAARMDAIFGQMNNARTYVTAKKKRIKKEVA